MQENIKTFAWNQPASVANYWSINGNAELRTRS
jgi:hypothetical protein